MQMSTNVRSKLNKTLPRPIGVDIENGDVNIKLENGEMLSTPLAKHPWLMEATPEQLQNFEMGYASVWWPDLDDGLDIEWLLMQQTNRQTSSVRRKKIFMSCPTMARGESKPKVLSALWLLRILRKRLYKRGKKLHKNKDQNLLFMAKTGV
jgi:hypothetical protein